MPVRLKDIAQELGVSVVTVSKSLRGLPGPGAETKARVLDMARKMNYGPNSAARALVTGRTNTIGLVVPELVHPFFAQIARSISAVLQARGYSLVVSSSEENPETEKRAVEQFVARSADGLLIASTRPSAEIFQWIETQQIPYVLVDRKFEGLAASFVGVDDVRVGTLATEHLIAMGCQRIAHIGGGRLSSAAGRRDGYEQTLGRHGLTFRKAVLLEERLDKEAAAAGQEAASNLLQMDPLPDGIFCYNDPVAMGAILACLKAGLRVPEDVAIVGCGNSHYDDYLRVPLTSIDQKSEDIGRHAAELAVLLVESKNPAPTQTILLVPELIVRESSQKHGRASQ